MVLHPVVRLRRAAGAGSRRLHDALVRSAGVRLGVVARAKGPVRLALGAGFGGTELLAASRLAVRRIGGSVGFRLALGHPAGLLTCSPSMPFVGWRRQPLD